MSSRSGSTWVAQPGRQRSSRAAPAVTRSASGGRGRVGVRIGPPCGRVGGWRWGRVRPWRDSGFAPRTVTGRGRELDQAEGQQPRRFAVLAAAVRFDPAAVGGLTAALLLPLQELLQRGGVHRFTSLAAGGWLRIEASVLGGTMASRPVPASRWWGR